MRELRKTCGLSLLLVLGAGACTGGTIDPKEGRDDCVAESDAAFCLRLGQACGPTSGNDNCGNSRDGVDCSGMCASASSFVISTALQLSASTVSAGGTLTATVTYKNVSSAAIVVRDVRVAALPPGSTHAAGPHADFTPAHGPATIDPSATLRISASRSFTASDAVGTWESYAAFQDSTGVWHDGPSVMFTVTSSGGGVSVSVTPSSSTVNAGATLQMSATVTGGTGNSVVWSLQEASGCGSVSSSGLYTAPTTAATCHVVATSAADTSRSAVATITVNVVTAGTPVALHGRLSVQGNRIIDEHGQPVQLRGIGFAWSQWWGEYWTAADVDWLADDFKVDLVRTAMGVEQRVQGYLTDATTATREKAKVITVADEAVARGIYVMIDWHEENATDHVTEAKAFFQEMATRYGQHPNVMYEIYNEPVDQTWPQIKAYADEVANAIRVIDPYNLIIVGTPTWSQEVDKPAANPMTQANIAYTLHFYAATHKAGLRATAQAALDDGVALFVTEWGGMGADCGGSINTAEMDAWIKLMDDNKLSWAAWALEDQANQTCAMLMPNQSPAGNWPVSSLSPWGQLIRSKLRTYAGVAP